MRKIIFVFLVLNSSFFSLNAQEFLDFSNTAPSEKRILLVPFDPRIYVNDATAIMLKNERSNHDELMQYFRYQFNLQLHNAMMDSCSVVSLFSDNTRIDQEDINTLYSLISYELVLATKNAPENPEENKKKSFFAKKKEEKELQRRLEETKEYDARIHNGEIVSRRQTTQDMSLNIVFHQPEVLEEIANRRNVDLFLFINQFEIVGNYGDPYLSGNTKAERNLKVHFSIYNTKGQMIHNSFGITKLPFNLDDKQTVVELYFPEVIRQIIHNISF